MLNIIGGSYFEYCREPFWDELYGSGFRSAVALSQSGIEVHFHTFADSDAEQRLRLMAEHVGVRVSITPISATVHFEYVHALSNAVVYPKLEYLSNQNSLELTIDDDVIYFGFFEGDAVIHGKRVIYDPQSPGQPKSFWNNGSTAEELVLILNYKEACLLAGTEVFDEIISYLIDIEKANVAVIKNGPCGAFVVHKDKSIAEIPAFRTDKVWTIGSGDIFTTYFAQAYFINGQSPKDAGLSASKATAWYSENRTLPVPADLTKFVRPTFFCQTLPPLTVYLAGPFFTMSQRWLVHEFYDALLAIGLEVFSPFHDVGPGGPEEVVEPDIEGLKKADLVLAILDCLDSGTLFEVGYATSLGKPIVGFCENEPPERLTMLQGSGATVYNDFVTTIYQIVWHAHV